ncbi:MAG: ATP-binding protein [Pararhodobacter sp.]
MIAAMLKSILPRGLFWRAVLILVVPVVTILLVVSVVFIQRHYEGVAQQMTENFARTVIYLHHQIEAAPDQATASTRADALGRAFGITVALSQRAAPGQTARAVPFYDLNARLVPHYLRQALAAEGLGALETGTRRGLVWLVLQSRHGAYVIEIPLGQVSARNPHQLLVVMLIAGVVISLVSFVFLKNQVRAISRLARAAEAFGRGQNLPYEPFGASEVRAAGRAFVEMRTRIEHHIEQRTLMLSGVSHDLRTPLTRIKLALSMLEHEPEAAAILADVRQMEALIDRFLDFARADVAELPAPVDLRALVGERVALAAHEGRDLHLLEGDAVGTLQLRRELFARALDNVIGNALHYARRAELRIEDHGAVVVVIVEDDGPGIPRQQRAEAFKPFVRLDAARGVNAGSGAGLGLAIAADALRSHGGRVELGAGQTPGLGGLEVRLVVPRNAMAEAGGGVPAQRA